MTADAEATLDALAGFRIEDLVMLRFVRSLATGDDGPDSSELLLLSRPALRQVGALLTAIAEGEQAVAGWLETQALVIGHEQGTT